MAWYALYKWFRPFRKKPYYHWVKWYKRELYNQWFNSLSEEEKNIIRKEEEKRRLKRDEAIDDYMSMLIGMSRVLSRNIPSSIIDSYYACRNLSISKSKYW